MKALISILLLCTPFILNAGGPLIIEGADGNTPVIYSNPNIALNFDIGMLGSRTNSEADALVVQALGLWNDVNTGNINLVQGPDLSNDIDETNYQDLLPSGAPNDPSIGDGLNPVIYDTDGAIIDDFLGAGQSDSVGGFAASIYFLGTSEFVEGYAVLNGKPIPGLNANNSDIVTLMTHEIGHFIGLDHSQLNLDNSETDSGAPAVCSTQTQDKYPTMYPFLCRLETTLHPDDEVALASLYPATGITQQLGQITGRFIDGAGNPIRGANIWALNTDTGDAYSIVSDYLMQNTGFFSVLLPAGTYTLHANSVNPLFNDVSSVGPYATDLSDVSFSAPHPITPVDFEGASPGSAQLLTVTTGEATNVVFAVDGSGTFSTGNIMFFAEPGAAPGGGDSGAVTLFEILLLALMAAITYRRKSILVTFAEVPASGDTN